MATATQELSRRFRAMNTDIEAIVAVPASCASDGRARLDQVVRLFTDIESALSRFRSDSELSALNATAGHPFAASKLLFAVVSEALAAARRTAGLFDPTILPSLVLAGYDRSFEQLPQDRPPTIARARHCGRWQEIQLDPCAGTISLPKGSALDLGGIGKGWALDRAAELLGEYEHFAVDAGGDIVVGGEQADGAPWTIGVEDPMAPSHNLFEIELADAAVATSTVAHRRWFRGGRVQHHLIDPRSGRPSLSGVVSATVVAASAVQAETLAKAALLLGPAAGRRFLEDQRDVEGILVLDGGFVQETRGFQKHCRVA